MTSVTVSARSSHSEERRPFRLPSTLPPNTRPTAGLCRLLQRISINEANSPGKKLSVEDEREQQQGRAPRIRRKMTVTSQQSDESGGDDVMQTVNEKPLIKLWHCVHKIRQCLNVFRVLRNVASENGNYSQIMSRAVMQLKDTVQNGGEDRDLMFDPDDYRCKCKVNTPKWARRIARLPPSERTHQQVRMLASMMKQLKDFRKYSKKMQLLLARMVRFERFGRRRVVIRKGQVGMSFYLIFSGSVAIVFDQNEDEAFGNCEKPLVTLESGSSFGEIALIKNCLRTATVVCLETSEFLVVEKEDFLNLGVIDCYQDELRFRADFLRSNNLFSSLPRETVELIAEGGRNIEFLSEKVIEMDDTDSDYIYVIAKGEASVLRLLDLTELYGEARGIPFGYDHPRGIPIDAYSYSPSPANSVSSGRLSRRQSADREAPLRTERESADECAVYSEEEQKNREEGNLMLPDIKQSKHAIDEKPSVSRKSSHGVRFTTASDGSVEQLHTRSDGALLRPGRMRRSGGLMAHAREPARRHSLGCARPSNCMPTVFAGQRLGEVGACVLSEAGGRCAPNLGLGCYMRLDVLTPGRCFGIKGVLHNDEQDSDFGRKFTLLSMGCELVRLNKSTLRKHASELLKSKVREQYPTYPSDQQLYQMYKKYNDWRCFREELVDHISEYKDRVAQAQKGRCEKLPRVPRRDDSANVSRPETPVEHWHRLVDSGHIVQESNRSNSPVWSVNSSVSGSSAATAHAYGPFVQQRLVASAHGALPTTGAAGQYKTLVLTHGGSRVNKMQVGAQAPLRGAKRRMNSARSW